MHNHLTKDGFYEWLRFRSMKVLITRAQLLRFQRVKIQKKKPCYCILNLYHFKEYVNVRINMDKYDYYQRFRSIQYKFWRAKE